MDICKLTLRLYHGRTFLEICLPYETWTCRNVAENIVNDEKISGQFLNILAARNFRQNNNRSSIHPELEISENIQNF